MSKAAPINLESAYARLTFLRDRTSETPTLGAAAAALAEYRDGAIFITHYAGHSEWERHRNGDEIVLVVDGETTLFLLREREELPNRLRSGELLVVPRNTWHRFESPGGVKVLTVTPQPTDHSIERPIEE
jgi:mannose-6-phosphate isomerase-like protein (cupin superfamily)